LIDNVESGIPEELEKSALKRNATFSTIPNFNPRARALDWVLYTGDMQLEATDPNLIQRYTLAVMAFQLDYTVWNNDPNSTSNETAEDDASAISDEVINWLTGEDVCEWYGVKCTEEGVVTEIHLCKQLWVFVSIDSSDRSHIDVLSFLRKLIIK
jgi:hypothetical protein